MFSKIKILSIAFLMLFSNVAFSATGLLYFCEQSNTINKTANFDVVKQCRGIVNMPKVFCDVCVELTQEIINISKKDTKNSNINAQNKNDDTIVANFETARFNNKRQNLFLSYNDKTSILTLNRCRLFSMYVWNDIIYYITGYIGLLRANDVINGNLSVLNIVKPLLVI